MKPLKRLKASLKAIEESAHKIPFKTWIQTQPSSTRKGIARGRFVLPDYVIR